MHVSEISATEEETVQAFNYRIELSWQYKIYSFLGPYGGSNDTARLGSIYVPLTFHLLKGNVEERIQLGDIIAHHPHLVLLGNPGSGKSMLSQVLAYAFSKEGGEPWTRNLGVNRMPILITLREYDTRTWNTIDNMLDDYIKKLSIRSRDDVSVSWLKQCLEQGKALLIWDGIDEIGNPETRKKLRVFFEREIVKKGYLDKPHQSNEKKNVIVLTSRLNGYNEVSFEEFGLQEFVINGFDQEEIDRFITKWYEAWEPDLQKRKLDERNMRLEIRQRNLRSLAASPFLLSMIVSVARISKGGIPIDRADLYDKIFDAYLVDIKSILGFKIFENPKEIKKWLSELAWKMRKQIEPKKGIFMVSKQDVLETPAPSRFNSTEFLNYVSGRSGLLVEHSTGTFCFAHPSFLEYLAAWNLRKLLANFDELVTECKELIKEPGFHDLLGMLFALLDEFNVNDKLFALLYEARHNSEKVVAPFFAKLASNSDNGLSNENKKLAIEFALKECCNQIDKSIIESLSQITQKKIIIDWFNLPENTEQIALNKIDFLITAIFLHPKKIGVEKMSCLIDNDKTIDETNKAYIRTTAKTIYLAKNSDYFVERVPALCFLLKQSPLLESINKKGFDMVKTDIEKDIIPELVDITRILCELYAVKLENNDFYRINESLTSTMVMADKNALEIILFNLMENAIKYHGYLMNPNLAKNICKCNLSIYEENGKIILQVEDYGIGIDAGEEEKIFTPQYHSEPAMRCRAPGIKYIYSDLYFCRKLAQDMGGNLELIKNSQPTTFKLSLPKCIN